MAIMETIGFGRINRKTGIDITPQAITTCGVSFAPAFDKKGEKGTDMRRFRLLYLLAAAALAAVLTVPTFAASYSDTSGNWAESAIEKWSAQYGILQGYSDSSFHPDDPITRGAFATVMDRFLKYRKQSSADVFSDISGAWCEGSVLKLNAAGVFLGDSGNAGIYKNISRQQAITMIARAFQLSESSANLPYADADSVMSYASGYLSTMVQKGYINDVGSDNLFRPDEPITRAEVVNILNNMLNVLISATGTYTTAVSGNLLISASGAVTLDNMEIQGDLILAPGATGPVTLNNTSVLGNIRNQSGAEIDTVQDSDDSSEKYTGEYVTYSSQQIPILSKVDRYSLDSSSFSWDENGRLQYSGSDCTTQFGIDVSAYQNRNCTGNTIDWDAVAADGVSFAMVRCGFRGTGSGLIVADSFYDKNIDGAMAAGLTTGVYFFSQAISVAEAQEEADYVINQLENHSINGPVAYDWEMKDSTYRVYGTSPEMATACAKAFCERIESAGYKAMVYAGKYVGYLKFDLSELTDYDFWYPEYKSAASTASYPSFCYQMDYWQYSSSLTVKGISGKVDGNLHFIWN